MRPKRDPQANWRQNGRRVELEDDDEVKKKTRQATVIVWPVAEVRASMIFTIKRRRIKRVRTGWQPHHCQNECLFRRSWSKTNWHSRLSASIIIKTIVGALFSGCVENCCLLLEKIVNLIVSKSWICVGRARWAYHD